LQTEVEEILNEAVVADSNTHSNSNLSSN